MKVKKKALKVLIISTLAILCVLVGTGCKGGSTSSSNNPPPPVLEMPQLGNLSVAVAEKPTAWFIGDYTLQKLEIDDKELDKEAYKVHNGYCILNLEYYGALGVGVHSVKMYFTEGVYEFSVSISDDDVIGEDLYQNFIEKDDDVIGNDIYENIVR